MKKFKRTIISLIILTSILVSASSCSKFIRNKKVEPINISKGVIDTSIETSPERKPAVVSSVIGSVGVVAAKNNKGISYGSAFLIDKKNGYILTNAHVVVDNDFYKAVSNNITVKFLNKKYLNNEPYTEEYIEMKVVTNIKWIDPIADVAILKIKYKKDLKILEKMKDLKFANSSDFKYGQEAIFIGNPEGIGISVGQAMVANPNYIIEYNTQLSFFGSEVRRVPYIQIDGNINHGNSGGPLFDLNGNVMGIVSLRRESDLSKAAPIVQGVGFVLRSDQVIKSIGNIFYKNNKNIDAQSYYYIK